MHQEIMPPDLLHVDLWHGFQIQSFAGLHNQIVDRLHLLRANQDRIGYVLQQDRLLHHTHEAPHNELQPRQPLQLLGESRHCDDGFHIKEAAVSVGLI
jgi:hypothetical protein